MRWLGKLGLLLIQEAHKEINRNSNLVVPTPTQKESRYNPPQDWPEAGHLVNGVDIGERRFYKAELKGNAATADYKEVPKVCSESEANLVGSALVDGGHMPVLDLDFPCQLVPSSTPGHFHLFLNKKVDSTYDYFNLLDALVVAGILEDGYVRAAKAHDGTFVRKPGIKKASEADSPEFVNATNRWKEIVS